MPAHAEPSVSAHGSYTPFYHIGSSAGGSSSGGSTSYSHSNTFTVGDTPDARGAQVIFTSGAAPTSANSTSVNSLNPSPAPSTSISKRSSSKSRPRTLARESSSLSKSSSRSKSPRRLKLKSSHSYRSHRMACHDCGTTDTPQWRLGMDGPGTLCNVCGLLFAKRTQRRISQFH